MTISLSTENNSRRSLRTAVDLIQVRSKITLRKCLLNAQDLQRLQKAKTLSLTRNKRNMKISKMKWKICWKITKMSTTWLNCSKSWNRTKLRSLILKNSLDRSRKIILSWKLKRRCFSWMLHKARVSKVIKEWEEKKSKDMKVWSLISTRKLWFWKLRVQRIITHKRQVETLIGQYIIDLTRISETDSSSSTEFSTGTFLQMICYRRSKQISVTIQIVGEPLLHMLTQISLMRHMLRNILLSTNLLCKKLLKMSISQLSAHKSMTTCIVDMIWLSSNSIPSLSIPSSLSSLLWLKSCMVLMIVTSKPIQLSKTLTESKSLTKLVVLRQEVMFLRDQISPIVKQWLLLVWWRDWSNKFQLTSQDRKERVKILVPKSLTTCFCSRKEVLSEPCIIQLFQLICQTLMMLLSVLLIDSWMWFWTMMHIVRTKKIKFL